MQEYQLFDIAFKHQDYIVPNTNPKHIRWNRNGKDVDAPTFFTDEYTVSPNIRHFTNKFGIIIESQGVMSKLYTIVPNTVEQYKLFFTHSSALLKRFPNTRWYCPAGLWMKEEDRQIFSKNKLCSIVSSDKTMCPLHDYRISIVEMILGFKLPVDVYGTFTGKFIPIIDSLKDYMFSIIIENYIDELYFTEKILNCFATGTIPIYLGAKNIGEKFNLDGIITLNDATEIDLLLNSLSADLYYSKMDAIKDNYERSLTYTSPEDYIYENYLCKL